MRTDGEDCSGKCICSQAVHFPIHQPSHLLNLPPLLTRCNPSVCSSGVISIWDFALTFGVTGKWWNWNHSGTYCSTHHKQKIALFSLSGCISSSRSKAIIYACSFPEIHARPCQFFSVPYIHLCNLFRMYRRHGGYWGRIVCTIILHKSS